MLLFPMGICTLHPIPILYSIRLVSIYRDKDHPKRNFENKNQIQNRSRKLSKLRKSLAGADYGWTPNAKWLLPPTVALPNTTVFRRP